MWASLTSSVAPWILAAQLSTNMNTVPAITPAPPRSEAPTLVRDRGGLFSRGAEQRAHLALRRYRRDYGVPVLIESVDSLRGVPIDDAARSGARRAVAGGLYVLVAGRERDVCVAMARGVPDGWPRDAGQSAIREAFLGPLLADDADAGLERGVRAIGEVLAESIGPRSSPRGGGATITFALGLALALASLWLVLVIRPWGGRRDPGGGRRAWIGAEGPARAAGGGRHPGCGDLTDE